MAGTEPKPSLDERLLADQEAARSGAARSDMDRVTEFAARQDFDVVQASAARRTVRVFGAVAEANRGFATESSALRDPYPQPSTAESTRSATLRSTRIRIARLTRRN